MLSIIDCGLLSIYLTFTRALIITTSSPCLSSPTKTGVEFRATAAQTRPAQLALLHFAQEQFANCSFVCKSISTIIRILLLMLSLKKGPSSSDVFIGMRLAQNICKEKYFDYIVKSGSCCCCSWKKDVFIGIQAAQLSLLHKRKFAVLLSC